MKSSTNTYLTALAVSDLFYLVCSFLLSLQHYKGIEDATYYYYWKILPFVYWHIDASSEYKIFQCFISGFCFKGPIFMNCRWNINMVDSFLYHRKIHSRMPSTSRSSALHRISSKKSNSWSHNFQLFNNGDYILRMANV